MKTFATRPQRALIQALMAQTWSQRSMVVGGEIDTYMRRDRVRLHLAYLRHGPNSLGVLAEWRSPAGSLTLNVTILSDHQVTLRVAVSDGSRAAVRLDTADGPLNMEPLVRSGLGLTRWYLRAALPATGSPGEGYLAAIETLLR